jgi:hypothetical protein
MSFKLNLILYVHFIFFYSWTYFHILLDDFCLLLSHFPELFVFSSSV